MDWFNRRFDPGDQKINVRKLHRMKHRDRKR